MCIRDRCLLALFLHRVNKYLEAQNENEDKDINNYIQINDVIWLCLSEKKLCLSGISNGEPFDRFFLSQSTQFQTDGEPLKISQLPPLTSNRQLNKLGSLQIQKQDSILVNKSQLIGSYTKNLPESHSPKSTINENDQFSDIDDMETKQLLNELMEGFIIQYTDYSNLQLQANALWKIEGQNFGKGGRIQWNNLYRLRHFPTGKYLSLCQLEQNQGYRLELTSQASPSTLFKFVELKMDLQEDKSKNRKYVQKETFFRIQNAQTKLFIGFRQQNYYQGTVHFKKEVVFCEENDCKDYCYSLSLSIKFIWFIYINKNIFFIFK
eukprot:TRINITY_DN8701_c0_g1_i1.p1 TRINITY_DN8701_c0_g1~~TRINITY_DN8701_c0_g1_i1.p1  ORF type:complete len:322 (-),score=36.21 TRINITY_DN8701_c0_g1_i1:165-1130(-)